MKLKFMSTFDCLYSFNLCLMDLGCPFLRGSSDRRLRRCAATDVFISQVNNFLRDFYQQEVVSDEKEVKEKQSNIQFTKGKENKDVKWNLHTPRVWVRVVFSAGEQ